MRLVLRGVCSAARLFPVDLDGAYVDEAPDVGSVQRSLRKAPRSEVIRLVVEVRRGCGATGFVDAGGQVNDDIHARQGGSPIGSPADVADDDRVRDAQWSSRLRPDSGPNDVSRDCQCFAKMPSNETRSAGYEHASHITSRHNRLHHWTLSTPRESSFVPQ